MPNIKELALKVGAQGLPIEGTAHKFSMLDFCSKEVLIEFAEALIAELAKQNEPVCEWVKSDNGNYLVQKWAKYYVAMQGDKLYTVPPTAEQIANETAEACAKYVNRFLNGDGIQDEAWIRDIESGIRRGTWKEFK